MKTILFQGDSITDCGRDRSRADNLGDGYPLLTAASLGADKPGEFRFFNRGVSGDCMADIYQRRTQDIFALKPDVMSLLIGVNDVWHTIDAGKTPDAAQFEQTLLTLLDEIRETLPAMKLLLLEPFILPGPATEDRPEIPDRHRRFRENMERFAAIVKCAAAQYGAAFVPLQQLLDEAAAAATPGWWLADGVHPTPMGHALIQRAWLRAFSAL